MINDTKLRKGNYIYFNPNGRPFIKRVKELRSIDLVCSGETESGQRLALYYTGGNVEPIPLTPEWMPKCGFSWSAEDQVYYLQVGNTVYLEYDVDFNCSIVPETWRGHPLHLWGDNKYLHQLQNLYQSHTGNELEIKL